MKYVLIVGSDIRTLSYRVKVSGVASLLSEHYNFVKVNETVNLVCM